MSESAGRGFFPTSSGIAAQDGGLHCGTCSVKRDQEVTADCVENGGD